MLKVIEKKKMIIYFSTKYNKEDIATISSHMYANIVKFPRDICKWKSFYKLLLSELRTWKI